MVLDPFIGTQTVTVQPGETTTLNFSWTPNASGRYEIRAYTSEIQDDMSPENNTLIKYIYVSSIGSRETGSTSIRFLDT